MTIEADLYTALSSLVSNRCYPLAFPLSPPIPTWPAIRYTIVSQVPALALCGDSGDEAADFRIQLDLVALTFKGARDLRTQVMAAMASFDPPAILQDGNSQFDQETKSYLETLDYLIYPSSPSA
jgi:hypothetical protein